MEEDSMALKKRANAAFYRAIGKSLTAWQNVEQSLAGLFQIVSTCQSGEVARAIFFSPNDFSEKLKMTHIALRTALRAKTDSEEWKPLRKRMIDESEFRNALAHFSVAEEWGELGHRYILTPTMLNPGEEFKRADRRKKKLETLDVEAIVAVGARFEALADDVEEFATRLDREPQTHQLLEPLPKLGKRSPPRESALARKGRPRRRPPRRSPSPA
jgi:hypothetical protein